MAGDILLLLGLVAGFLYWWNASKMRELARRLGRAACETEGVQFLDDTVALGRIKLCYEPGGRWSLCREYRFEFATNGGHRYGGEIVLQGGRLQRLTLEPYRISPLH